MKAEEKFPKCWGVADTKALLTPEDIEFELRELLAFWDAHQWQPESEWEKQAFHAVVMISPGYPHADPDQEHVIGQWDGVKWIDYYGCTIHPTHIMSIPKGPQ
jgi:hypothetical protein